MSCVKVNKIFCHLSESSRDITKLRFSNSTKNSESIGNFCWIFQSFQIHIIGFIILILVIVSLTLQSFLNKNIVLMLYQLTFILDEIKEFGNKRCAISFNILLYHFDFIEQLLMKDFIIIQNHC